MDMRTSTFSYGSPDFRLTNSAFADLYHYYGLPMWSTVGTDAHALDEQAAMEHAFCTLLSTLDGANLIHDIGYLGQGLLEQPGHDRDERRDHQLRQAHRPRFHHQPGEDGVGPHPPGGTGRQLPG